MPPTSEDIQALTAQLALLNQFLGWLFSVENIIFLVLLSALWIIFAPGRD